MPAKKYIGASVMIIIILLPVVIYISLCIHKNIVSHQMEERLENASLKTILLKKDAFTWVKMNSEIEIKGKLFDVKSYKVLNDEILFTGLFDEDEDAIKKKIDLLTSKNKQTNFPIQKLLKVLLSSVATHLYDEPVRCSLANFKIKYFCYNEVAVSRPTIFFTPPPNF